MEIIKPNKKLKNVQSGLTAAAATASCVGLIYF